MMTGDFRLLATAVRRSRGGSVALGGVAGYAFEGVAEGAFGGVAELAGEDETRTLARMPPNWSSLASSR
jgi:hypothetical protein